MFGTRRLSATLHVKQVDAGERLIAGWAAITGNVDRVADVIEPGAFRKTLAEKAPAEIAVFIGHDMAALPVGVPVKVEETPAGLYTETRVFEGPAGDNLLAVARGLAEHGQTLGMSIGYRVRASRPGRVNGKSVRRLTEIDLIEYSFAARQTIANPAALVVGVKAGEQMYHVEEADGRYHVMRGDKRLADFATEAEARAKLDALNASADEGKAEWSTAYVNSLPDSAFLYVEPGGQKDEDGRTVPRSLRHFPYRDADGEIDLPHLRNAIARIPQSSLSDELKRRLQARARRMLEQAGDGKTVGESDPDTWKSGIALDIRAFGYTLLDLSEAVVAEQAAMATLGTDTKAGLRTRLATRDQLRAVLGQLDALVKTAEEADRDDDPKAVVDWYRQWFDVAAIGAPSDEAVEV